RLMAQVVIEEVPAIAALAARALETRAQVVRNALGELPRRVDDVGREERVPRVFPYARRMRARLHRQHEARDLVAAVAQEAARVEAVGDVIDLVERDPCARETEIDRVK